MILSWIKTRINRMYEFCDRLLWRVPFLRVNMKLLATQISLGHQKLSFSTLDTIGLKLWSSAEISRLHNPVRALLFETSSRHLNETDRYIKLRYIQLRARTILNLSGCLVEQLSDESISRYTGWEKDPIEVLIDRAENANKYVAEEARRELMRNPKLQEYLEFQSKAGRHELVKRALVAIIADKDNR